MEGMKYIKNNLTSVVLEAFLSEFYFPSYIKPDFDFIKLMCELKNKKLVQKSA